MIFMGKIVKKTYDNIQDLPKIPSSDMVVGMMENLDFKWA